MVPTAARSKQKKSAPPEISWNVSSLDDLPSRDLRAWLAAITEADAEQLLYDWRFWARPEQICPPGNWRSWFYRSGRGSGKTRTGTEFVREEIKRWPRGALIGRRAADPRDVLIEGPSGLLNIFPPHQRPNYEPSKRKVTFHNGAEAHIYSAEEPDQLRGPQHGWALCDELAAWKYARETWDNLWYGLRESNQPRAMIASTPRPTPLVKEILADPATVVSTGSTYDNRVNLPRAYIEMIRTKYEGTKLAQQEIYGKVIEDNVDALWTRETIDNNRVLKAPDMTRILVAVDVATTSGEHSDETGIIGAGIGTDGHGYILEDATCTMAKPEEWAKAAVTLYYKLQANGVVAESNQGGEMIAAVVHAVDSHVPVELVHASRGKHTRAEPVAAMDAQGKIHHVGNFPELEDQMCQWQPDDTGASPDRMDARVWAISKLFRIAEKALTQEQIVVYDAYKDVAGGGLIGAFDGM